jgi:hypothetical protein
MMDRDRSRSKPPIAQKYLDILRVLCVLDVTQRAALIRKADSRLLTYLCECVLNILRGNVPLTTKKSKSRLRKHAPLLRKLAAPIKSRDLLKSARRKLLIKSAHLLPLIVKPVLSAWSMPEK